MVIHKHWFGLFLIILSGILLAISVLAVALLIPAVNLAAAVLLAGEVSTLLVSLIAIWVYQHNAIIIHRDRIEFRNQYNLLSARSSECAMWEVQDVSYTQVGLFPALIGYGTLMVQTAGTQEKFTFSFTPKPEWVKDYIEGLEVQEHAL